MTSPKSERRACVKNCSQTKPPAGVARLLSHENSLGPRPRKGASALVCFVCPLAGVSGTVGVRRLFFCALNPTGIGLRACSSRQGLLEIMSMKQWFIQSGDEVVGPLSSRELRLLAAAGGLSAETLVSVDRQHWVHAEEVPGLEMKPRQEVAVTSEVIDVDPAPENPRTRPLRKSQGDTAASKWPQWILMAVAIVVAQVVSKYWLRPPPLVPSPWPPPLRPPWYRSPLS